MGRLGITFFNNAEVQHIFSYVTLKAIFKFVEILIPAVNFTNLIHAC